MDTNNKKQLCAVCGLFCLSCTIYIGAKEEPKRLRAIADRHEVSPNELECNGCRSEKRSYWYDNICQIKPCADKKGVDFCIECDDYPCNIIRDFQKKRPHRIELWKAQDRIAKVGYLKWFDEMIDHYSCSNCHTINSAYDILCRKCGAEPSCQYVKLHIKEIKASLLKQDKIKKK